MKHRAVTLVVMILLAVVLLVMLLLSGVSTLGGWSSLVPLAILVAVSAVAGLAFSWRRYFPRARR